MSTYDETKGGNNAFNNRSMGHVHVLQAELDCAKANDGNGLSSSDVAKVINLPANHQVLSVRAEVLEAEGGTLTFDVGDSGNATRWHSNLDGNTTSTNAIDTTTTTGTSADDVRVTVDNAADKARIEVTAVVADLQPNR